MIAKIVGNNVRTDESRWAQRVDMYTYEEMVDGQKLTEIINTKHENVKYLPGFALPDNVVSNLFVLLVVGVFSCYLTVIDQSM